MFAPNSSNFTRGTEIGLRSAVFGTVISSPSYARGTPILAARQWRKGLGWIMGEVCQGLSLAIGRNQKGKPRALKRSSNRPGPGKGKGLFNTFEHNQGTLRAGSPRENTLGAEQRDGRASSRGGNSAKYG